MAARGPLRNREMAVVLMRIGWWPDIDDSRGLIRFGDVIAKMEQWVKAAGRRSATCARTGDFERAGIPATRGKRAHRAERLP